MEKHIATGEITTVSQYVPMTSTEVRDAAIDLIAGNIVGSWQFKEHEVHLMTQVFMPLMLMDDLQMLELKRDEITHVFGHVKDSAGRSINGFPMFFSFRPCTLDDVNRILAMAKKLSDIDEYD